MLRRMRKIFHHEEKNRYTPRNLHDHGGRVDAGYMIMEGAWTRAGQAGQELAAVSAPPWLADAPGEPLPPGAPASPAAPGPSGDPGVSSVASAAGEPDGEASCAVFSCCRKTSVLMRSSVSSRMSRKAAMTSPPRAPESHATLRRSVANSLARRSRSRNAAMSRGPDQPARPRPPPG